MFRNFFFFFWLNSIIVSGYCHAGRFYSDAEVDSFPLLIHSHSSVEIAPEANHRNNLNPGKCSKEWPSEISTGTNSEISTWNGSNWDPAEPDSGVDAVIAADYTGNGFDCRNLTIQAGKKLWPLSVVNAHGNVNANGLPLQGHIHLAGNILQQIQGSFDDLSLDNSAGALAVGNVSVYGTLSLIQGNFNTNNHLTIKSTSEKTGRLAAISTAASLSGEILMERFVSGSNPGWFFLGTPVKNQVQSDWGDDFLLLPSFIFRHMEGSQVNNGWVQATDSLFPGTGFRVYLNQSFFNSSPVIRNKGIPVMGDFSFKVSYTQGGFGGGGWNLLANPYPCEIDWHALNRLNIGEQVQFWNGNKYATYNAATQVGINNAGRFIASSQGFFVKATASSPSLTISETAKPAVDQNPVFNRTAVDVSQEVARIKLLGNNTSDETAIRWMPVAQPYFEDIYDADKIPNPDLNIFSLSSEGIRTSIQARNFLMADSVNLGFSVPSAGTYFLHLTLGTELLNGKTWSIRDNESGYSYPVGAEMLFPFTADHDLLESPIRFTLIGRKPALSVAGLQTNARLFLFPNPGKESFHIYGLNGTASYRIESADGKLMAEGFTSDKITISGHSPGLYLVRITHSNGESECLKMVIIP